MSQFTIKFKLIFLPFVYIALGIIVIYTALHWLLFIKLNAFHIGEDFIDFFIPAGLSFIVLVIYLRPRIKLLKLNVRGRHDPIMFLILLAGCIIITPTIIAQKLVETATGKLSRLDSIGQINAVSPTKYYTVNRFYSNKRFAHGKVFFSVSGKNHSDFNMDVYVAVPVFNHVFPDTNVITTMRKRVNSKTLVIINGKLNTMMYLEKLPADSIRMMRYLNPSFVMPKYGDAGKFGALAVITQGYKLKKALEPMKIWPIAWLAIKYEKRISNSLSYTDKQHEYKLFEDECEKDFKHKQLDKFVYLSRFSNNSDEIKSYQDAIKSKGDVEMDNPTILIPVYESFEKRNGDKLTWILSVLLGGAFIFLAIISCIKLKKGVGLE